MKVVIEVSTENVVYFLGGNVEATITARGLLVTSKNDGGKVFRAMDVLPDTHAIIGGIEKPEFEVPAIYGCNAKERTLYIRDQALYDETRQEFDRENFKKRMEIARGVCSETILSVMDQETQINMNSYAATGLMGEAEIQMFRNLIQWTRAMRKQRRKNAADPDADLYSADSWPAIPDGAAEFASNY